MDGRVDNEQLLDMQQEIIEHAERQTQLLQEIANRLRFNRL